jgi:hypothetical protein
LLIDFFVEIFAVDEWLQEGIGMSFYRPPPKKLEEVVFLLTEVRQIYADVGAGVFAADNLMALARNLTFMDDQPFAEAIARNSTNAKDADKIWRLHTYWWAGRTALSVPGDLVECGVYKGFY